MGQSISIASEAKQFALCFSTEMFLRILYSLDKCVAFGEDAVGPFKFV